MRHILGLVIVACAVAWGAKASASELTVQLGWVQEMSRAVLKFARQALVVDKAMR
jgi:hypothetical protein